MMNIGFSRNQAGQPCFNGSVLVVDDEQDIRDALVEIIKGLGLRAFMADSVASAKALFRGHRQVIDLVITDLKMDQRSVPHSAGAELIDWLSVEKARCPVVVLTANGTMDDMASQFHKPLVASYLPKSADLQIYERAIADILSRRGRVVTVSDAAISPSTLNIETETASGSWRDIASVTPVEMQWNFEQDWLQTQPDNRMSPFAATLTFSLGLLRYRVIETPSGRRLELAGDGLRRVGRPGCPALPVSLLRLALPQPLFGLTATIESGSEDWVDLADLKPWDDLIPIPAPSIEGRPVVSIEDLSNFENWYQDLVTISEYYQTLDGVPCVTLQLCPFHFESSNRKIKLLRGVRVRVSGKPERQLDFANGLRQSPIDSPLARQVLGWGRDPQPSVTGNIGLAPLPRLDGPSSPDGNQRIGGGGGSKRPRYLAVGTEETLEAIAPLLAWHQRHLDVLDPLVIGKDVPLPENAEAHHLLAKDIRSVIQQRLGENDRALVLLAGGENTIPFFRHRAYQTTHTDVAGIPILSDLWYAGYEPKVQKSTPLYAIGRLPFDDPGLLREYCERMVDPQRGKSWRHWLYLSHSHMSYQSNVARIVGEFATDPRVQGHVKGPAMAGPVTAHQVDNLLGKQPSIITFRGHGLRGAWELASGETLGAPPLRWPTSGSPVKPIVGLNGILSIACCTAAPDRPINEQYPAAGCGSCNEKDKDCQSGIGLGVDALASGQVMWFLGASRKSWSDVNDDLHRYLTQEICADHAFIGEVQRAALVRLIEPIALDPQQTWLTDNAAMSVLLGDPAAPVCPRP